ncbi:MAG: hypothetical protein HYY37_00685 [Candidatus Aenigmarchaeota archaeon]|nr:hypothetical protein [Candidatus Aenigmarchaeota archaeon]
MAAAPLLFFLASLAFNIVVHYLLRIMRRLRIGIDSLLFCAIMTGYLAGPLKGLAYGAAIAVLFFFFSRRWEHALVVMPLNGMAGVAAGALNTLPFFTAAAIVVAAYHVLSVLLITYALKQLGPGYALFVVVNIATTYALLMLAQPFL